MDVKAYYKKIRTIEQELPQGEVVVVSLDTPDGGRAGRVMELSRQLAAKMIVDQRARLAEEDEVERLRDHVAAEQVELASRYAEPSSRFTVESDKSKRGDK